MKKTLFKSLLATSILAAAASVAHAESYKVTSVPEKLNLKILVQGAGTYVLNNKTAKAKLASLNPTADIKLIQELDLHDDHTFTGAISSKDMNNGGQVTPLFILTGRWDRPLNGKTIYIAVDGDPTDGEAADGTFGALFDQSKAELASLPNFIPLLFDTKIFQAAVLGRPSVAPVYSTIKQTGTIKLDKLGTAGKLSLSIGGRGVVDFCKMNKATDKCDIPKGPSKEVAWGFTAATPVTVTDTTPAL